MRLRTTSTVVALALAGCSGDETSGTGGSGGAGSTSAASTSASGSTSEASSSGTGTGGCPPFVVGVNEVSACFIPADNPRCTVLLNGTDVGVCTTTCEFDTSCLEGDRCYIETVDDGVCLHACDDAAPCEPRLQCVEGTCRP